MQGRRGACDDAREADERYERFGGVRCPGPLVYQPCDLVLFWLLARARFPKGDVGLDVPDASLGFLCDGVGSYHFHLSRSRPGTCVKQYVARG